MKDWSQEIAFVDNCTAALPYLFAAAVIVGIIVGALLVWFGGW